MVYGDVDLVKNLKAGGQIAQTVAVHYSEQVLGQINFLFQSLGLALRICNASISPGDLIGSMM